jgi:hypothetical protein
VLTRIRNCVATASLNGFLGFRTLPSLAHDVQRRDHRNDAAPGDGGARARDRANSISPGLIETNQTREQLKDPEWARAMLGKTLLGRLGRPEEAANVAPFLASDASS